MKVLIVDDEILVRKGIAMGVEWAELGFDEVQEASNGLDALDYAKEHYPELVLTDIKMPKMDGLELIEKLKQFCPDTVIIVLSCVDDTDYVRKSMKFGGAIDYILKLSLSTDELAEVIKRAKPLIKERTATQPVKIAGDQTDSEKRFVMMSREEEKQIQEGLAVADDQAVSNVLKSIFSRARNSGISPDRFFIAGDILGFINSEVRKRQGNIHHISIHGNHPYNYVTESSSLSDMEGRFDVVLSTVMPYLKELRQNNYTEDIGKAVDHILAHYCENITLSDVGQVVGLNTAYLSRKFKEETGINFVDYVNKVRIDRAKELLESKDMTIHEVAETVGFSNDTYFSRLFKNMEGISPKQYQKQH